MGYKARGISSAVPWLLAFLVWAVLSQAVASNHDSVVVVWQIKNMHQHPWFFEVVFGSVGGWILGMVKGFSSSSDWLQKYWPSKPAPVVFVLDLLIFVVLGGYFGTGIYNPTNFLEAIAAGLSWPVGLGALATKGV